jgi:hypothetical protein
MVSLRTRNELEKEGTNSRRCHARQQKEAWDMYEAELAEYNKRKSERETEERCVTRAHILLTTRYERRWKNSKRSHIPTRNKYNSEKFSRQRP